jgi:Glycosyltransferase family 20
LPHYLKATAEKTFKKIYVHHHAFFSSALLQANPMAGLWASALIQYDGLCASRRDYCANVFELYTHLNPTAYIQQFGDYAILTHGKHSVLGKQIPVDLYPDVWRNKQLDSSEEMLTAIQQQLLGSIHVPLFTAFDRCHPHKGHLQRLQGIERFLEQTQGTKPALFFNVITHVNNDDARQLFERIQEKTAAINEQWRNTLGFDPIVYYGGSTSKSLNSQEVFSLKQLAALSGGAELVTSVAEGFHRGPVEALITGEITHTPTRLAISEFVPAADYIEGCITFNPHNPDAIARAILHILNESSEDRRLAFAQTLNSNLTIGGFSAVNALAKVLSHPVQLQRGDVYYIEKFKENLGRVLQLPGLSNEIQKIATSFLEMDYIQLNKNSVRLIGMIIEEMKRLSATDLATQLSSFDASPKKLHVSNDIPDDYIGELGKIGELFVSESVTFECVFASMRNIFNR